jgi:hypothetical protein
MNCRPAGTRLAGDANQMLVARCRPGWLVQRVLKAVPASGGMRG